MKQRNRRILSFVLVILFLSTLFPIYALADTYQVAPGDSLWQLAQRFAVRIADIKAANSLKGDMIYIGQKLEIPAEGKEYQELKQEIQDFTASRQAVYGIYFQDLVTGRTFGINEHEPIHAASTIKLPIVLYLNELAARGKVDWQEKLAYEKNVDWQDGAGILQFSANDGDEYSLRVLANLAITLSDNIAAKMITRYLGKENIQAYMTALGGETVYPDGKAITTARDMGLYVRRAYDFSREYPDTGQRLLDDLANTIWHIGLPGELPPNLTVAHKEGTITGIADDAGIVFGSRPFILVVLSKDITDEHEAFQDIAHISKMVYDFQEQLAR